MRAFRPIRAAALAAVLLSPIHAAAQGAVAPCVAVVLPSVVGVEGSATAVATALRDLFVSYLNGPALRTVTLEARLPAQAVIEARQKGCERMLLATMVLKRGGGNKLGGVLGQAAGTAAWHAVPYGLGAAGAAARGAAVAGAQVVSGLASDTRRKDEVRLTYRIGPLESVAQATPVTDKAKAKSDGEDLLTPLVERAAQDVFTRATSR
jgi:hypothetical protein